jgi:hypothetical protein
VAAKVVALAAAIAVPSDAAMILMRDTVILPSQTGRAYVTR